MRHADEVSVLPAPPDRRGPRCELRVHSRSTAIFVAGLNLEAAVEVDGRYLVFLTDGFEQEELLSIHLVGADGRVLDTVGIGRAGATGAFRHLVLGPPREVGFHFLGDAPWTVAVDAPPRFAWPLAPLAPGVHPRLGWRRWLRVRTRPAR